VEYITSNERVMDEVGRFFQGNGSNLNEVPCWYLPGEIE
jgi:hypothetical protein